jgi:hypothetical protein
MNLSFPASLARILATCCVFILAGLLSGCESGSGKRAHTADFYLEKEYPNAENIAYSAAELYQASGNRPVVNDKEIEDVDLVRVDAGVCLLFHLSPASTMRLAHTTANNFGKRLILVIDGKPVGVRMIDEIIQNGQLFTFTELSTEEMGRTVIQLKQVRNIAVPDGKSGEGKPIGR